MCRLFGFRSVIQSQVHSSLVSADNALEVQSNKHADGWGVCYYMAGSPHIIKSEKTAVEDSIFKKISGIVSSETVLAHLRAATLGETSILNTHPFQFGNWVFAHNGNIKNFDKFKNEIKDQISPELKRFILGSTDSELIFYFILSNLSKKVSLENRECDIDTLAKSVRESVNALVKIIGNYSQIDNAGNTETYITFILTNGKTMISHQGGKNLFYSTYKNKCVDRETCPSFSQECEAKSESGYVNHLIFTSEPLSGDNIWVPMKIGQLIGVDSNMKLQVFDN